jgi:hypothetical protein
VLRLDETNTRVELVKSSREEGPVMEMIDRMQLTAFRNYSALRNDIRQKFYGFIIQVRDILRAGSMKEPVVLDVQTQRLHLLLTNLDQIAYQCKQKLMEESNNKDKTLRQLDEVVLGEKFAKAFEEDQLINIINIAAMLKNIEYINSELAKIDARKINETTENAVMEQAKSLGVNLTDPRDIHQAVKRSLR